MVWCGGCAASGVVVVLVSCASVVWRRGEEEKRSTYQAIAWSFTRTDEYIDIRYFPAIVEVSLKDSCLVDCYGLVVDCGWDC